MKTAFLRLFCLTLTLVLSQELLAQDPQYTQFYANPLFVNPGFAGATGDARVSVNYRMQWPGLDVSYSTYSLSYDQFVAPLNSGFGFYISRDETTTDNSQLSGSPLYPGQKTKPLVNTSIAGFYSYLLRLNEGWSLQMGLQAGLGIRQTDGNFIFEDQILGGGGPSPDAVNPGSPRNYFDFSSGAVLYSRTFWAGFSAAHINQPNQSLLLDGGEDILPMRLSLQMGYRFDFSGGTDQINNQERSIMPVIMYRVQGKSDQLDAGVYAVYEPLILGVWYRGLPFKAFEDVRGDNNELFNATSFRNSDAIAFLLGFKYQDFSIGYSYDITTSSLGFGNTAGSHEISLTYHFRTNAEYDSNRPQHSRFGRIYCPNPWKIGQRLK